MSQPGTGPDDNLQFRERTTTAPVFETGTTQVQRQDQQNIQDQQHGQQLLNVQNPINMPAGNPPAQPVAARPAEHLPETEGDHKARSKTRKRLQQATSKENKSHEYEDKAQEYKARALLLPANSEERKRLLKKKEENEIEANSYKKKAKILRIRDEKIRERELNTFSRHERYDFLKKLFYKPSQFAREEAEYTDHGKHLVNIGRAFFGGTKPMYKFEDRDNLDPVTQQPKIYLYKEAVNCIGMKKTSGAIVTEAASHLQRQICGDNCYIEAFTTKDNAGNVVGSMQRMVNQVDEAQRFNLFDWQEHPDQTPLPEPLKKELLREHTLDWLLCNFDTKGENFLHQSTTVGQQICSFDKEASFSFIGDEGAQHMSTTYKPHSNNTIYNVIFTEFAEGRLDLNLHDALEAIQKAEALDDQAYMQNFSEMLTSRYDDPAKRAEAAEKILQRKRNLRTEYENFFTEILNRRRAVLAGKNQPFDHNDDLGDDGRFHF